MKNRHQGVICAGEGTGQNRIVFVMPLYHLTNFERQRCHQNVPRWCLFEK